MSSIRTLDDFGRKYLLKEGATDSDIKAYAPTEGAKGTTQITEKQAKLIQDEFIQRAGSFTEDLIGFIVDQKRLRDLDDKSVVFAIALANINLRNSFCSPQNSIEQKEFDETSGKKLSAEWDEICWAAQCYYNENP